MSLCAGLPPCLCEITGDDIAPTGSGAPADPFDLALSVEEWTSFIPTITNLTLGNSVRYGRYKFLGKLLLIQMRLTFGSTSAFTNTPFMSLTSVPSSPAAKFGAEAGTEICVGSVSIRDSGTRMYAGSAIIRDANPTLVLFAHTESGNAGLVNATNPMTWASGDELSLNLFLEVA